MDHKKAFAYAEANGYDGAEYLGQYEGHFCYDQTFDCPAGEEVSPTGFHSLILSVEGFSMLCPMAGMSISGGGMIIFWKAPSLTLKQL